MEGVKEREFSLAGDVSCFAGLCLREVDDSEVVGLWEGDDSVNFFEGIAKLFEFLEVEV